MKTKLFIRNADLERFQQQALIGAVNGMTGYSSLEMKINTHKFAEVLLDNKSFRLKYDDDQLCFLIYSR